MNEKCFMVDSEISYEIVIVKWKFQFLKLVMYIFIGYVYIYKQ